jgi:hypothetical protein
MEENSEMIWKILKKGKSYSEKVWKIQREIYFPYHFTFQLAFLPCCLYLITIRHTFLPYFPYHFTFQFAFLPDFPNHFTIFFHIFPIFSQFSSVFSKSFYYSTNRYKIWKIWKKGKLNSEKI